MTESLPSVGSQDCGIQDAIENHKTGVLVDNHSPDQIKKALDEILNKVDLAGFLIATLGVYIATRSNKVKI